MTASWWYRRFLGKITYPRPKREDCFGLRRDAVGTNARHTMQTFARRRSAAIPVRNFNEML
jgi:hypothetical protein